MYLYTVNTFSLPNISKLTQHCVACLPTIFVTFETSPELLYTNISVFLQDRVLTSTDLCRLIFTRINRRAWPGASSRGNFIDLVSIARVVCRMCLGNGNLKAEKKDLITFFFILAMLYSEHLF